jgi:hypothetical protein
VDLPGPEKLCQLPSCILPAGLSKSFVIAEYLPAVAPPSSALLPELLVTSPRYISQQWLQQHLSQSFHTTEYLPAVASQQRLSQSFVTYRVYPLQWLSATYSEILSVAEYHPPATRPEFVTGRLDIGRIHDPATAPTKQLLRRVPLLVERKQWLAEEPNIIPPHGLV